MDHRRRFSGGGDGAGATRTRFVDVEPRTRGPLRLSVLPERFASAGTTCSPRQTVIQDDAAATCGPLQVSIYLSSTPMSKPALNKHLDHLPSPTRMADGVRWSLCLLKIIHLTHLSSSSRISGIGYTVRNRIADHRGYLRFARLAIDRKLGQLPNLPSPVPRLATRVSSTGIRHDLPGMDAKLLRPCIGYCIERVCNRLRK